MWRLIFYLRTMYWSTDLMIWWSSDLMIYWSIHPTIYWYTDLMFYWSTDLMIYWYERSSKAWTTQWPHARCCNMWSCLLHTADTTTEVSRLGWLPFGALSLGVCRTPFTLCSATKVCDCVATPQVSVSSTPLHFHSLKEHYCNGSEHFQLPLNRRWSEVRGFLDPLWTLTASWGLVPWTSSRPLPFQWEPEVPSTLWNQGGEGGRTLLHA